MTYFGILLGTLIIVYGIISVALKRSLLFGGDPSLFTEKSIRKFAKWSGGVEIIMGAAVLLLTVCTLASVSLVTICKSAAIIWLAIAVLITIYFVVLVRKE